MHVQRDLKILYMSNVIRITYILSYMYTFVNKNEINILNLYHTLIEFNMLVNMYAEELNKNLVY